MNYANKYGQWALVTGGSTGIGLALARQAASCGMDIVLVARRAGLLAQAREAIQAQYKVKVKIIELDLTSDAGLGRLFAETENTLGRKAFVIGGLLNKVYVWLNRFSPRSVPVKLYGMLVRRAIRKENRVELLSVPAGVRS